MAANLDQALQPDETIVFRARGRSFAGRAILNGTIFLALISFLLVYASIRDPGLGTLPYSSILLYVLGIISAGSILVLLFLQWDQRRSPDDLAITNRRLLFANSDWDDKIETLDLDRIDRVAWVVEQGIRQLTITGAGMTIRLPHLRNSGGVAGTIAEAADIGAPPALTPIMAIDPGNIGAYLAGFASYPVLWLALDSGGPLAAGALGLSLEGWWQLAISALAGVLAVTVGMQIGGPLVVTVMRPFMTSEQVQSAICAGNPKKLHVRIALKWAGLLYGRPLPYVAC